MLDGEAFDPPTQFPQDCRAVVSDLRDLHEGVQLQIIEPLSCARADLIELCRQPRGVPLRSMSMPVRPGTPEPLQPNDVGVRTGMSQQRSAVSTDQDRQALLMRSVDLGLLDLNMLTVVGHDLTVDESTDHLDALHQPSLTVPRVLEGNARCPVLLRRVSGTDAQLESSL